MNLTQIKPLLHFIEELLWVKDTFHNNPVFFFDTYFKHASKNFGFQTFHGGGPYHIETCLMISSANQCTGFYMIRNPIMKELNTCSVDTCKKSAMKEFFFRFFANFKNFDIFCKNKNPRHFVKLFIHKNNHFFWFRNINTH